MEEKRSQNYSDDELKNGIKQDVFSWLGKEGLIEELTARLARQSVSAREAYKKEIINSLLNNNQSVSNILVTKKGVRLPPTVANWLNDYRIYLGENFDPKKRGDYLESPEFTGIDTSSQARLKSLFDLYDLLAKSSLVRDSESVIIKDQAGKFKIWEKDTLKDLEIPVSRVKIETTEKPAAGPVLFKSMPREDLSPTFHYAPEDEAEINGHKNVISSMALPETADIDEIIIRIVAKNSLNFSDDILEKRFESIAKARLKEIRNDRDTLDILTRSKKIGGTEFPETLAQKVLDDLNQEIPKLHQVKPAESAKPEIPIPYPKAPVSEIPGAYHDEIPAVEPAAPMPPLPEKPEIPAFAAEGEKRGELSEVAPAVVRTRIIRPTVFSEKRRVEDIRSRTRPLGPIEELKAMSLNEFRALATDKASSIQRVYDKLNLLKDDSFAMYSQGVKAWRESDVYRLYLEMGRESMESTKTINEIIESRKKANLPHLDDEEFMAVADLNKKTRF